MLARPRRGEVFWVDFEPHWGVEQKGRRPALVVQNDIGNLQAPYTVVVAISAATLPRLYPFLVPLRKGESGIELYGHVNCAHLLTIDQKRLLKRIGTLSRMTMQRVDEALRFQLAL